MDLKSFKKFNILKENRDESITGLDFCFDVISEGSLSRLWQQSQEFDYCMITAYKDTNSDGSKRTKEENVLDNRKLRNDLNNKKLGVHPCVGHYQECPFPDMDYNDCPKDKLVDVIERSYFVPRVKSAVKPEEFADLCFDLAVKYKQNTLLIKVKDLDLFGVYDSKSRKTVVQFEKGITFNKMAQAYSQYVRKLNVPFVFEGAEIPTCLNFGKLAFRNNGFRWIY